MIENIGNEIFGKKIKIPSRQIDVIIDDVRNELNNIKNGIIDMWAMTNVNDVIITLPDYNE